MVDQGQTEEPDMDKNRSDQGWEQLQAHIERFLGQTLRNDVQAAIEYKPRFNSGVLIQEPSGQSKDTGPMR
jgi:hypothetical protein